MYGALGMESFSLLNIRQRQSKKCLQMAIKDNEKVHIVVL